MKNNSNALLFKMIPLTLKYKNLMIILGSWIFFSSFFYMGLLSNIFLVAK